MDNEYHAYLELLEQTCVHVKNDNTLCEAQEEERRENRRRKLRKQIDDAKVFENEKRMAERAKERESDRLRWFWKICSLIATSIVVIIICKMCICKAIFKVTSASGTEQVERRAQQARVTSLPVPTLGETEAASPRPTAPPPPSPGIVPTAPQVGIIKANLTKLEGAEVRIGFYDRVGRIIRGDTSKGAEGPEGWPRG